MQLRLLFVVMSSVCVWVWFEDLMSRIELDQSIRQLALLMRVSRLLLHGAVTCLHKRSTRASNQRAH